MNSVPARTPSLPDTTTKTLGSTLIIVKILYDKREFDTLAGRLTLGVLVLQDLFAIIFLALQPSLAHPKTSVLLQALCSVVVLIGTLAWCFLVAGLAGWLGLSVEMGALVAGVAIFTFPCTLDVMAKVAGLGNFL